MHFTIKSLLLVENTISIFEFEKAYYKPKWHQEVRVREPGQGKRLLDRLSCQMKFLHCDPSAQYSQNPPILQEIKELEIGKVNIL